MSHQLLENDYVSFHLREMERDVNMIKRNAEAIFKILDEYENLVESKFDA
jgi:hypothetical protein